MGTTSSMSDRGAGYAFSGERAQLISRRLAYIARHGSAFLFNGSPPPAPGWPQMRPRKAAPKARPRVVPAEVVEQRALLAELVAEGMTIRAAAAVLGKSQQRASQIWREIVAEMGAQAV